MADISRVVDEVRGFLLSYDQSMKPELAELARAYAELCVEANKRLARCQRLLQQGLRAEAIHRAKEPPDLLDSIQSLDFVERPAWFEIVRQYDLAIPPDFDATAIEFLHAAYVEDNPLRDLLRSHRRLALQRAPLARRLQVLRELAEKDPNSPIWPADIQIFEAARIGQLKLEAAEAKRLQDVVALGLLNDELSSKSWSSPPPKPLARDVAQALSHLRGIRKRQDQVGLIAELHDAFAALDVDKGRELRNRWRLMDGEGNPAENPLYKQVEPVFLWLDERDREEEEENRYHQALADLAQSLEEEATRAALEKSHQALVRSGRGVPEDLDRRYRERIEHFSRQAAKRTRGIAASVVSLLAACLVVAALVQRQRTQEAFAREAASRLDERIKAGRFAEARTFFGKLSRERPQVLRHPAVVAAATRLASKEAAEARRAEEFDEVYRQARVAPVEATEPGALASARKLAVTEDEKRRVEALSDRRRQEYLDALARIDAEARPKLQGLADAIAQLEARFTARESEEQVRESLRETTDDLRNLKAQVDRSSDETRQLFEVVSSRSDRIRAELDLRDKARNAENDIVRATRALPDDPDSYARALDEAIARVPNSPKAADYGRVLEQKPIWAGALAWASFARRAKLAPKGSERPAVALARAAECEKILGDTPRMPDRGLVEELRDHYRAISLRARGEDDLRKQIIDLLGEYAIRDVYITTIKDVHGERTYYSKEPMDRVNGLLRVMGGYKPKDVRSEFLNRDFVTSPPKMEAPQSKLAANLKDSLSKQRDLEGWDAMMLSFLKAIADDSTMDPILKYVMIRNLAPIAGEGSRPLALGLEPLLTAIKGAGIGDGVRWMNPLDAEAINTRPKARAFLNQIAAMWPDVARKAEFAHQTLADKFDRIPQPVGLLVKEGSWTCREIPGLALPATADLCVVSGKSQGEWETVGSLRDKIFGFSPQKFGKLAEGALVFARPKAGIGSSPEKR
jgi:hypothetical protein